MLLFTIKRNFQSQSFVYFILIFQGQSYNPSAARDGNYLAVAGNPRPGEKTPNSKPSKNIQIYKNKIYSVYLLMLLATPNSKPCLLQIKIINL